MTIAVETTQEAEAARAAQVEAWKEFRRHAGKIRVERGLIELVSPEALSKFFGQMVIVRCEYLYPRNEFEYTALCAKFDALADGEDVPEYSVTIHTENGEVADFTFTRCK